MVTSTDIQASFFMSKTQTDDELIMEKRRGEHRLIEKMGRIVLLALSPSY
jgi:hypothetical protein